MGKENNDDKHVTARSAGVLLHITSLPSAFGTGDLGPAAFAFADFLSRARQKYWQVLPLNPTEKEQHYSPYSATSAMAGNMLLISPEALVADDLLTEEQIAPFRRPVKKKAAFKKAKAIREELLDIAYSNFQKNNPPSLVSEFQKFCNIEAYWLNDYVLYVLLKKENNGTPWHQWPESFRLRNRTALNDFIKLHHDELSKEKWLQFIFFYQWHRVKDYCNESGIKIFGDLPFYVSYDSADVWANQELFKLNEQGGMTGIAGVPPDYFNENGQLWGMPVFRWEKLKKTKYEWWIKRISKNVELFDLIRLDHFRAFSSYWEVPSGETTAINGKWKKGPGALFFEEVKNALGKLPFVAEDLGDIDENVYQLRDQFALPGMKVIQFAFGENMSTSEHIPHNYNTQFIAYTGTHDNNTTQGWYNNDISLEELKHVKVYVGNHVRKKNIHRELSKITYASVAETVILPMQDVMGLGEKARMNMPATTGSNWLWRMAPGNFAKDRKRLKKWTKLYNRNG